MSHSASQSYVIKMDTVLYFEMLYLSFVFSVCLVNSVFLETEFKRLEIGAGIEGAAGRQFSDSAFTCSRSCSGDERCNGYQYNSGVCQIIRTFSPHDQNHTFVASDANLVFKKDLCIRCRNGARCVENGESYTCECLTGYTGFHCELFDECASLSEPCRNNGTCVNTVLHFRCACATGYTGASCELDIDECAGAPCENGGNCTNHVGYHTCDCASGFTGSDCEINVDECQSNPCLNGGACVDGVDSFTCDCPSFAQGATCKAACPVIDDWAPPAGWTAGFPVFYLSFENDTCIEMNKGAQFVQGKVNRSVNVVQEREEYVYLGQVSRLTTCFTLPDLCTSGATLTAWIRIVRCTDSSQFPGVPDGGILSSVVLTTEIKDTTGFKIPCGATQITYEMILTDGYYDVSTGKPVGWYYLALVFHGPSGGITVYHDGVQVGEEPDKATWFAPYVPGNGTMVIGRQFVDRDWDYGSVMVDELTIWEEELSQADIMRLYNSTV